MALLAKNTYRLVFLAGYNQKDWINPDTKTAFYFPAGVDLQIKIGVAESLDPLSFYDLSDVSSIKLEVKELVKPSAVAPDADAGTLIVKTVTALDDADLSVHSWEHKTSQHATFEITAAESNIPVGRKRLVISAVMNDSSQLTLGWGDFEVAQDSTGAGAPVLEVPLSYYPQTQVDALLVTKASLAHASQHATGGADELTPSDIGAAGYVALDAPLATVNTANTVETTGPILGQTTDDQLVVRFSQTAGTDGWRQVIITDSNGVAVVDILLEDSIGVILEDGILARVGQSLVFGDGASLAESLPPILGRRNLTLINRRSTSLSLDDLGVVGKDTFNDPINGWIKTTQDPVGNIQDTVSIYDNAGLLLDNIFHHDGSAIAEGWYDQGFSIFADTGVGIVDVGQLFELKTNPASGNITTMGGRMRGEFAPAVSSLIISNLSLSANTTQAFVLKYRVYDPSIQNSYVYLNVTSGSSNLTIRGYMEKTNNIKNDLLTINFPVDASGNFTFTGASVSGLPYPGNYCEASLFYTIQYYFELDTDNSTTVSFELSACAGCVIDVIEAAQV